MTVYVIEAFSYGPEDVQGVFSSVEAAERWLTYNGWSQCFGAQSCYGQQVGHWHAADGWRLAHVKPHEVQE